VECARNGAGGDYFCVRRHRRRLYE
jgi:hypothetical protein